MKRFNGYGDKTKCIHVGNDVDMETGAIRRPIYMNNSYRATDISPRPNDIDNPRFVYARDGNANQYYLERRLASLEGGEDCLVVASGVAAINGTLYALLNSGDHLICSNPCYISVYIFLKEELTRFGIEHTFVDGSNLDAIEQAIKPNTKLIHIETPGNPVLKILDIGKIAEIAHGKGILLSVDATFAMPLLQKSLNLGADLAIHSLSKYINGHGDALGGAVIGRKELIDRIRLSGLVRAGAVISPFNAWLVTRGMSTLPLRMKQHCESAMRIAEFLEKHPGVEFVRYPGLESHPQHDIAKRQMSAYSGMLNFRLRCCDDGHMRFLESLDLILPAVSLGHDESLIVYHSLTQADGWYHVLKKTTEDFGKGFFRLSVGLEDTEDLIGDIVQAMGKIGIAYRGEYPKEEIR